MAFLVFFHQSFSKSLQQEKKAQSKHLSEVGIGVLAATHRDLKERVHSGEFRKDLYYRIKVVEVPLPKLMERRDDIPLLATHF